MSAVRATTRAWSGIVALACCAAWAAAPAAAQSASISVSRTSDAVVRLNPTESANVAFRIAATGLRDTIAIRIDRPATWRAIAPPMLVLPRDSVALRIVGFMVPSDARAGSYTLRLHATSRTGRSAVDSVTVIVGAKVGLEVDVEEAPGWVLSTDTFAVKFRVFNRGNVPVVADMRPSARDGVRIETSAVTRRLNPGESHALLIRAFPEAGRSTAFDRVLSLAVSAGNYKTDAVARVDVLDDAAASRARGLPGTLRVRMTDASGKPSVQLNANGPIREGSATRASILVQGPHSGYSMFSETDVYRAALVSRNFSLRLGDNMYAASPLTSTSQQTTGAGGDIRVGPLDAGGFISWNRRSLLRHRSQAAFARVNAGSVAGVGVTWSRQEEAARERELASATASFRLPGGWLEADGEYGLRYAADARAYSVHARTARGIFSAEARRIRADSAYGGPQGGSRLDAARVALRTGRFFMEASAQERGFERPALNASYSNSMRSSRVALGFGQLRADVRQESIIHDSPWSQMDRVAESASARLRIAVGALALTPQFEIGRSRDHVTGAQGRFWRAAGNASITSSTANYSGQFEYFTGGTLYSAAFGEGMRAALAVDVRPTRFTRIGISANGARYFGDPEYRSVFATAALEHQLRFGHTIVLRTGFRGTAGRFTSHEFVMAADYRIPFQVPLLSRRPTGSIRGRIYDAESGLPLARAVVDANGRRTATSADGRFEIRGLTPGAHLVRVDRGTVGHRITAEPSQPVDVSGGSTSELDFPMIAGARLSGMVGILRGSPASRSADVREDAETETPRGAATERFSAAVVEPLSGAVIELVRGTEQIRRTADEQGRFEFPDLRPGRWAVSVAGANLPAFFSFDPDTVFIELLPGGEAFVDLRAKSVARPIRMLDIVPQSPTAQERPAQRAAAPARARAQPGMLHTAPLVLPPGWTVFKVPTYMTHLRDVARVVYLETGLWPKIWLANRDLVPNPDQLAPGAALRIPPRSPLTPDEWDELRAYMRTRWQ